MKVLFATDFYTSSTTARALLTALTWPVAARLDVLHVLHPLPRPSLFAGRQPYSPEELEAAAREVRAFARDVAARVEGARGSVQYTIHVGDPASAIIDRAAANAADLVVIGGPGRAESESGQMSPLSAAVISQTPCSVLVARAGAVDRLIVADGGAPAGRVAARVARWPLLRSLPAVTVLDATMERDESLASGVGVARNRGGALVAELRSSPHGIGEPRERDDADVVGVTGFDRRRATDLVVIGTDPERRGRDWSDVLLARVSVGGSVLIARA